MKTIEVMGTGTKIMVANAEEMYIMYFRLHGWMGLKIDNDEYPCDPYRLYTRGYFQERYFAEGRG